MLKGKTYEVYYRNDLAFSINSGGKVVINNNNILPMDIYVEESDDIDDRANNIVNFNSWCSERIIPLDRKYAKEILAFYEYDNTPALSERANIGLTTRCVSLNDCFWVKDKDEALKWEDVNLFQNSLDNAVFELPLTGKRFTINRESISPDINTDGKAAKAWKRQGNDFYLLKADGGNDGVTKETEASDILHKIFGDYVVKYSKDVFNDTEVSVCKCFTNETYNMVKADYYSIYLMNKDESFSYYLNLLYRESLECMVVGDYLVGNIDRHPRNWGVIYDYNGVDLGELKLSPIYDFDHAFEGTGNEICQPYHYLGRHISSEKACLEVLEKDKYLLDRIVDLDLSAYNYGEYVKTRIDSLCDELTSNISPIHHRKRM